MTTHNRFQRLNPVLAPTYFTKTWAGTSLQRHTKCSCNLRTLRCLWHIRWSAGTWAIALELLRHPVLPCLGVFWFLAWRIHQVWRNKYMYDINIWSVGTHTTHTQTHTESNTSHSHLFLRAVSLVWMLANANSVTLTAVT